MHAAPHPFVHDALVRERRQTALAAAGQRRLARARATAGSSWFTACTARSADSTVTCATRPIMRPGLHWPMLPWIYVRAAACAATNHAPLDPSAIMDQQALDRRAQAQSATTGSRRGPISKKVVTFSNSKPGSSASAPGGNRSTNDSSPMRATTRASVAPGHTWAP